MAKKINYDNEKIMIQSFDLMTPLPSIGIGVKTTHVGGVAVRMYPDEARKVLERLKKEIDRCKKNHG